MTNNEKIRKEKVLESSVPILEIKNLSQWKREIKVGMKICFNASWVKKNTIREITSVNTVGFCMTVPGKLNADGDILESAFSYDTSDKYCFPGNLTIETLDYSGEKMSYQLLIPKVGEKCT